MNDGDMSEEHGAFLRVSIGDGGSTVEKNAANVESMNDKSASVSGVGKKRVLDGIPQMTHVLTGSKCERPCVA